MEMNSNPKEIYISRDLKNNWKIWFDQPILGDDGIFRSLHGQWEDLDTHRWNININKGQFIKYILSEN